MNVLNKPTKWMATRPGKWVVILKSNYIDFNFIQLIFCIRK